MKGIECVQVLRLCGTYTCTKVHVHVHVCTSIKYSRKFARDLKFLLFSRSSFEREN